MPSEIPAGQNIERREMLYGVAFLAVLAIAILLTEILQGGVDGAKTVVTAAGLFSWGASLDVSAAMRRRLRHEAVNPLTAGVPFLLMSLVLVVCGFIMGEIAAFYPFYFGSMWLIAGYCLFLLKLIWWLVRRRYVHQQ